jgi:hypothetical protein
LAIIKRFPKASEQINSSKRNPTLSYALLELSKVFNGFDTFDIENITTSAILQISNKSFIDSPAKEKAKTYKLSFGLISESDCDISLYG